MVPNRFFSLKKYTTLFITAIVLSLYGVFVVFAAAPNGGYTPGGTLDPDCAPGDVDCLVKLSSGISIGQTITGGTPKQVLYTDNAGNLFSDSNFVRDSATQETQILTNHTVTLSGGTVTITGLDFFYIDSISGTFIVGETITDTNSGATATLESFSTPNGNDSYFSLSNIIGTFSGNDSLVGNTSGATATIGQGFFNLFNIGDNVDIFSFPGGVPTPAGTGQVTNISGSTYTIQVLTGTLSNGDVLVNMTTGGNSVVGVSNLTIPSSTLTTKSGYVSLADIGIGSGNQGTGLYTDNTTNTDKLFAGIVNGSKFGILSTISGVTSQYFLPSTDGSADQVLTTNGAGQVSWATVSSSISVTGNDTLYSSGLSGTGQDGSDNIFLGNSAGSNATNAQNSNFLGSSAGYGATSAYNSNFLGQNAGNGATNASYSNFFGQSAGYYATSASNSNFLGYSAGYGATSAWYSNFLGYSAGQSATYAQNSNFLGYSAGENATYASYSNFLGSSAGENATYASYSNFLGSSAGSNATNASGSNFFGSSAGYSATNANSSNFFGSSAGNAATNAAQSNFFGNSAGTNATNAQYSNFLGFQSGYNASNAANSIFIGKNAGYGDLVNNTVSGSSIAIGDSAGTGGNSNSIALGASAINTLPNQFLIGSSYTNFNVRGINYVWPATQAAGSGYTLTNDGSGNLSWTTGLSIGGTSGQLQYNNAGALGGVSGITFDGTNFDAKDSVFRIVDNSDTTKRAIFEVSGIDAGTTRTYTLPNTAGTIALTSDLSGYLKNSIGISGGTTLVGGTASGESLTLSSTSHATKGKILFGTSAYDEVNNQLGIGTTTPSSALEIANGGTLKLGGGTAINQGNILMNSNASNLYDTNLIYLGSNSQTMGMIASSTPAFLSSYGPSIFLRGNSYGAISGQRGNAGLIAGNPSSPGSTEGQLQFYTGATLVRMVIGYNGNVGIGTTSPGYKLDIQGAAAETSLTNTTNNNRISFGFPSAAGGEPSLSAFTTGVTNGRIFQRQTSTKDVFIGDIDANGGGVHIRTNGNDSLNILSGGNVGIGQSSPTAYLHLKAGTATANTAPLKFTSGTNLTTAEAGAFEYDGSSLFFTRSGALRAGLLMTDAASPFNTYSQSAKGATAFISGTDNFLGGQLAGGALTAGSQNVLIGTQAGNLSNAGLSQAVFLGYFAGQSASGITTGSVFIGSQAGQNGAGSYNSNFVGQLAGFNASSAYHSNLFGYQAGYGINANNVNFFGQNAGYGATGASYSNFLGDSAGYGALNADASNFFGKVAGYGATGAISSNFFGTGAGYSAAGASNSIFIGDHAGSSDTVDNTLNSDDFSMLFGKYTSTGGYSNSIAIGGYATNTASNQLMIGSATRPINTLVLTGASGNTCTLDVTVASPSCSSDERLKTNIEDLTTDTLDKVINIKTVSYNWNNFPDKGRQIGFLAQDLEQYFPEVVSEAPNGFKTVSYGGMTPILVQAIREMNLKITDINNTDTPNSWRDALIAWFGNTANGITDLFTKRIHTDELCVGTVCVTQDQFLQMVNNSGMTISPGDNSSTITPDSEVITTNTDSTSDPVVTGDNTNTDTEGSPDVSPTENIPVDSGDTPVE